MKIAIVTPYHREQDHILEVCLKSVADQSYKNCRHFLVADGFPNALVAKWEVSHIILPSAHGDTGNLARCIGAIYAVSEGFDGIAFLDADNWYTPDHIGRLVELHKRTGASVCTSGRTIHRLDGSFMYLDKGDSNKFIDTSCLCIFRSAFDLLPLWGMMPPKFGEFGDRVMWQAILERGLSRSHSPNPTVGFRSQYAASYRGIGEKPPPNAKKNVSTRALFDMPPVERASLLLGLANEYDRNMPVPKNTEERKEAARVINVTLEKGDIKFTIEAPDAVGIRDLADEILQRRAYKPIKDMNAPAAILDIGANVGLAAAYFRMVYPSASIFCVEPDLVAYEFLRRNARVIGNCKAYRAGLYNTTCTSRFPLNCGTMPSTTLEQSNRSIRILLLDADKFLSELPVSKFDLVKIDSEGAEVPIVYRLRSVLEKTPVIQIKYYNDVDRRIIDQILASSHHMYHGTVETPHRGPLTYVMRQQTKR
jgi:FkbM family methyltransferase